MTDQELVTLFSGVLGDLLGRDPPALSLETRREEVPGWDSFTYVNFIVAVEMRLGVKFRVAEVESFENVGAIVRRAQALLRGT
jgi:acyl carrier protein